MLPRPAIENRVLSCGHCAEYELLDRRSFLAGGALSAAAAFGLPLLALPGWMPRVVLTPPHVGPRGDTLVCIFLRGGADGLNIVVPHGDDEYYAARPVLAIARPDDRRAQFRSVDLDGFFGLHPALAPLQEIYSAGSLAIVHATGSPDETRSHFEAMALMERGATASDYSGWLARHLATFDSGNQSPLRAIGVGDMLPASLTGAVSATALKSIGEYHLAGREEARQEMETVLAALYQQDQDMLSAIASRTLSAFDLLKQIDVQSYRPAGRAYPEGEFGMALQMVAQLVKADVGVEVASVDLGGWDTHAAQGGGEGQMARQIEQLGTGLAAFYEDLSREMDNMTVVVMSEFGRRVDENATLGTDHGHGNMMLVMGNGINGGQVYTRWPGLAPEQRVGPGDLAITTDYRDVLGEIITHRLNNPRLADIFPGYQVNQTGLARPRS